MTEPFHAKGRAYEAVFWCGTARFLPVALALVDGARMDERDGEDWLLSYHVVGHFVYDLLHVSVFLRVYRADLAAASLSRSAAK